jgi:hypothetical protein
MQPSTSPWRMARAKASGPELRGGASKDARADAVVAHRLGAAEDHDRFQIARRLPRVSTMAPPPSEIMQQSRDGAARR